MTHFLFASIIRDYSDECSAGLITASHINLIILHLQGENCKGNRAGTESICKL